ncbi:transferase [Ascochyta rabiei]|uniref:Transferase n=1 Tax=Didymella rabiei TaxID=5454 RepID=A0A162Z1R4_DIDRA|nr:transferase [Ascochyta rabiei]
MASHAISSWERIGLKETDRGEYLNAVQRRYKSEGCADDNGVRSSNHVRASNVAEQLLVQLRPAQHALDLQVAREASRIYSYLAPKVRALDFGLSGGLRAYEMNRIEGIPMSCLQPREDSTTVDTQKKQETLIASFASVVARGWPGVVGKKRRDSVLRADSLPNEEQTMLAQCTGKVGSCVIRKLGRLAQDLPDIWLRGRAQSTIDRLCMVDEHPVVLNHGDLIPSNILVDKETWEITGLVDWAEAEFLPFGTCLYGLEHLLGFSQSASQKSGRSTFTYYENAPKLREYFWTCLFRLVPEITKRQKDTWLMRDVGVLLWYGYAWDEGAIDRVVDEANDCEELMKLRAFLSIQ